MVIPIPIVCISSNKTIRSFSKFCKLNLKIAIAFKLVGFRWKKISLQNKNNIKCTLGITRDEHIMPRVYWKKNRCKYSLNNNNNNAALYCWLHFHSLIFSSFQIEITHITSKEKPPPHAHTTRLIARWLHLHAVLLSLMLIDTVLLAAHTISIQNTPHVICIPS